MCGIGALRFFLQFQLILPEHRVLMVINCNQSLFAVRHHMLCFLHQHCHHNIFFSETIYWILTKHHRNDPWVVHYQSCFKDSSWLHKKFMGSENRCKICCKYIWHMTSSTTGIMLCLGSKMASMRCESRSQSQEI